MEQIPRAATLEDLKTLIKSLNEQNVEYLLIGGYALYAHGYHRYTTDIDIIVPTSKDVGERLIKALMVLPDKCAKDIEPAWFEQGETIRVVDEFVVDIMFNTCGQTYEKLKKYSETIEIDGIPVKTLNLEGLYLTKQSFRARDIADKEIIKKALEKLGFNQGRI